MKAFKLSISQIKKLYDDVVNADCFNLAFLESLNVRYKHGVVERGTKVRSKLDYRMPELRPSLPLTFKS